MGRYSQHPERATGWSRCGTRTSIVSVGSRVRCKVRLTFDLFFQCFSRTKVWTRPTLDRCPRMRGNSTTVSSTLPIHVPWPIYPGARRVNTCQRDPYRTCWLPRAWITSAAFGWRRFCRMTDWWIWTSLIRWQRKIQSSERIDISTVSCSGWSIWKPAFTYDVMRNIMEEMVIKVWALHLVDPAQVRIMAIRQFRRSHRRTVFMISTRTAITVLVWRLACIFTWPRR